MQNGAKFSGTGIPGGLVLNIMHKVNA